MEEDFDFTMMMAKILMDAERKKARQMRLNKLSKGWSDELAGSTVMMSQKFWELTMRKGGEKDGTRQASMIGASSVYGCHR